MKRSLIAQACLGALTLASLVSGSNPANSSVGGVRTNIGVISYWYPDPGTYAQLPAGSIALVNPDNGILTNGSSALASNIDLYKTVVRETTARGVKMLGYVSTGYFDHSADVLTRSQTLSRITDQVQAYFANLPEISGIFFDEVAPKVTSSCAIWAEEYARLRSIVKSVRANASVTFNTGGPELCAVQAASAGETVIYFESDAGLYRTQSAAITSAISAASAKGVFPWVLVHSVPTASDVTNVLDTAGAQGADLAYVTNLRDFTTGDNTWGSLPPYWAAEVSYFSRPAPTTTLPTTTTTTTTLPPTTTTTLPTTTTIEAPTTTRPEREPRRSRHRGRARHRWDHDWEEE